MPASVRRLIKPYFDRFPARSNPLEYHPGKYLLQQDAAVQRRGIKNPLQHAQQRGIGHVTAQRLT